MRYITASPIPPGPPSRLLTSLEDVLTSHGHLRVSNPDDSTVLLFDMQYGFWQYNWDLLRSALHRSLPTVVFDFFDYYESPGSHFTSWHEWAGDGGFHRLRNHPLLYRHDWSEFLIGAAERGMIKLYFMRQMMGSSTYPSYVEPIEHAEETLLPLPEYDAGSLVSRPGDACFIGMSSQCRCTMICSLLAANRFNIDWQWPIVRLSRHAWLQRHRQSKFFIESDGGGFGSNRPHQLCAIAPMLKQRHARRWAMPWTNMVNCVEIGDRFGNIGAEDVEVLLSVLNDHDRLYSIYRAGAQHVRDNFSEDARARYVHSKLEQHGLSLL